MYLLEDMGPNSSPEVWSHSICYGDCATCAMTISRAATGVRRCGGRKFRDCSYVVVANSGIAHAVPTRLALSQLPCFVRKLFGGFYSNYDFLCLIMVKIG